MAATGARFRYEATVGAGLPIIQTLRDLLDTGDELNAIDGIFSGTLAWLFNRYDGSVAFSELVREAHRLGYTEPDPRDDLSGTDVARKLVILAREAGWRLSLDDVRVESLVPENLRGGDAAAFMASLPHVDDAMHQRFDDATRSNRVLRYVAHLDRDGRASCRPHRNCRATTLSPTSASRTTLCNFPQSAIRPIRSSYKVRAPARM